jgi:hypothetical protein
MKNYMTAMANGNYGKAFASVETENLGNKGDSRKLFASLMGTNEINLSKNFTIEERSSRDTRVVFNVTYTLNGDEHTDQVTLERKGRAWRIRENSLPVAEYMTSIGGVVVIVPKRTTELRMNGVRVNNNMMLTAAQLRNIKSSGIPTADPLYGRYITDDWDVYWFDGLYAGTYTFETKSPRGNATRTVRLEGQRNGLAVFATQEDFDKSRE